MANLDEVIQISTLNSKYNYSQTKCNKKWSNSN